MDGCAVRCALNGVQRLPRRAQVLAALVFFFFFKGSTLKKKVGDPCVIVCGTLYQSLVTLVNVYAPNWDHPNFMTSLFSKFPILIISF